MPGCPGLLIAQELAIEPSPTFPFLESQCQRAQLGANFHLAREDLPFARPCLACGVGGVYRRANLLCQMRNRADFRFFVSRFAAPALGAVRLRARTPFGVIWGVFTSGQDFGCHGLHAQSQGLGAAGMPGPCGKPLVARPGTVPGLTASALSGGQAEPVPRFAFLPVWAGAIGAIPAGSFPIASLTRGGDTSASAAGQLALFGSTLAPALSGSKLSPVLSGSRLVPALSSSWDRGCAPGAPYADGDSPSGTEKALEAWKS